MKQISKGKKIFWRLVLIMPFIIIALYGVLNMGCTSGTPINNLDAVITNINTNIFYLTFIKTALYNLYNTLGTTNITGLYSEFILNLVAYYVTIEFIHFFIDCILFIFNFVRSYIDKF